MRCPKCRGNKVGGNKIGARATGLGHFAKSHPVAGAVLGAIWLASKAIDAASHEYKCEGCSHTFSSSPGACQRCTDTTTTMFEMNCCKARLCETCMREVNLSSAPLCELCNKAIIRK